MKRITSLVVKSLVTFLIGSGSLATNLQAQSRCCDHSQRSVSVHRGHAEH